MLRNPSSGRTGIQPGKAFFTRKGGEHVSEEVALSALGPTAPDLAPERTLE
jgi:hypothetical protein